MRQASRHPNAPLFDVEQSAADKAIPTARAVKQSAANPTAPIDVPLVVDAAQVTNWADAHCS